MSCYAPLFVNVNPGGMQWESDLIGYDAMRSYGSPSYHAQVMFSTYLGDEILDSKLENGGPKLFYSVTEDTNKSRIYVKLVNAESKAQSIHFKFEGPGLANAGKLITLRANSTEATNTLEEPARIVPVESSLSNIGRELNYTAPPYSIQVIQMDKRIAR